MENIWFSLLQYARWTPSPHNVQAWKLKIISDSSAELYYDPKRLLPVTDPTGCFSVMGFAMFVDSLNIASSKYGKEIQVEYEKKPFDFTSKDLILFAQLTLNDRKTPEEFSPELIKERRTSRLPYNNVPVPEKEIDILQKIGEKYGQHFFTSSEEGMVKWIMDLNRDTLFYDMGDEHARKEIGNLLRYNESLAREKKDGLWSYCFHIPGWFMKLFFDYEKFFELPIIKHILLAYYETTMKGTRTVAWIQGPFKTFDDYINAGLALNRIWLKMQDLNLYLHPFGSVITNPNAHERLREKFKLDEEKEMVWLLLRVGYSEEPPRSLRLDVDDILIK